MNICLSLTALLLCYSAIHATPALKPQAHCPFKNEPIKKEFFIDIIGKRIYTCCKECLAQVKANPQRAIHNLKVIYGEKVEDVPK